MGEAQLPHANSWMVVPSTTMTNGGVVVADCAQSNPSNSAVDK
jgi:hypothetical protein